jgi:hypothetical protein
MRRIGLIPAEELNYAASVEKQTAVGEEDRRR